MRDFVDDDPGYLAWLADNPDGFVLNTTRNPSSAYLVLHRASCRTIGVLSPGAAHWTREYRKICGRREEVESYARDVVLGEARSCMWCR